MKILRKQFSTFVCRPRVARKLAKKEFVLKRRQIVKKDVKWFF